MLPESCITFCASDDLILDHVNLILSPRAMISFCISLQGSQSKFNDTGYASSRDRLPLSSRSAKAFPVGKSLSRRCHYRMHLRGVLEKSLRVLVVGSGGREHALVESIKHSAYTKEVLAAPGNVGMEASCRRLVGINPEDVDAVVNAAVREQVDFVVVGPEVPLVSGMVDRMTERGILAFGPFENAAILEGSKVFSKEFMLRHAIPTAWYATFTEASSARRFISEKGVPIVIKADGLAAGKGVIIARTLDEAFRAVDEILVEKRFGSAGNSLVVEEFLEGEELSFFAMIDGNTAVPLASAQDHKASYDGDTGPNTGGMGAYSPAPICDDALQEKIMAEVVRPTMLGMKEEGRDFRGILFCGLMVERNTSKVKVLEYNVRFGDPECQVLCTRMKSDLLELLYRTAKGSLDDEDFSLTWHPFSAVVVVLASKGYPGPYRSGTLIRGVDDANTMEGVSVFHAGTTRSENGDLVSNGGRVLGVTAIGESILHAQKRAYQGVSKIDWPESFYRSDIGWRAVAREAQSSLSGTSK